jgi:ABC-type antimicrobial peptide transport system permease subunit
VYGVISYGVNQETREFGLRLALGATPRDILRLVVLRGLRLVAIGGTLGLAAGLLAARGIAGALYGVGPADPAACAGAVALLAATAILACAVPAWKASRTDPATTLRFE